MKLPLLLFSIFIARANSLYQLPTCDLACNDSETGAREYIGSLSDGYMEAHYPVRLAKFEFETHMTEENKKILDEKLLNWQKFTKESSEELPNFCWNQFNDTDVVRLATIYYEMGENIPDEILKKQSELKSRLQKRFGEAAVCKFADRDVPNCKKDFPLIPNINDVMLFSKNHEELLYYWTEWRENTGDQLRDDYIEFIKIGNKAAKSVGFKDLKEKWLQPYEVEDLPSLARNVYSKRFNIHQEHLSLEDLYKELHTYVKGKLIKAYENQTVVIEKNGMIPAHLLGEMYGNFWYLIDLVRPFPKAQAINLTEALIRNKYKAEDLYRKAEDFFVKLGFERMPQKFWDNSMLVKPVDGRAVDCHGAAWEIHPQKNDFRITSCTRVMSKYFQTAYFDMGNIVYSMQYRNKSFAYRVSPNPGIHLAIGDLASLAVNTPSNLEKLGLLRPDKNTQKGFVDVGNGKQYLHDDINYLMDVALRKIVLLPYTLVMDTWRWNFFSGKINETNLNKEFWRLRNEIAGIEAPVPRNETNLDPASLFHVPNHYPYIEYYVGYITQFQFYEALCKRAKEYDPTDENGQLLHLCDFSKGGADAGEPLRKMMSKGKSQHWNYSMEAITGSPDLSGESMLRYFLPLYKYLKHENENSDVKSWK